MSDKSIQRFYQVRSWHGRYSTIRSIPGTIMSEVIDKAFKLYETTWKVSPDIVEIKQSDTY